MHDYKSINFSSKKNLVAEKRFELLTLRVWTECSSQLSYSAMIQRNQVRELMFSLDWLHFYINTFLRICQYKINKFLNLNKNGDPTGIRTRVTAVKGRCLEPLDHRAILYVLFIYLYIKLCTFTAPTWPASDIFLRKMKRDWHLT